MQLKRVIPTLLLRNDSLVKTIKFKDPKYVGDPINAVRIFNTKEVDELVLLDITATRTNKEPNFSLIKEIVSEAFMPIGYGGGIKSLNDIKKLFKLGVDKVILNSAALTTPNLIKEASEIYGAQSIIVSLDIKKDLWGNYRVYRHKDKKKLKSNILDVIKEFEALGTGEVIVNSVDKDGTMMGYDLPLIEFFSKNLTVPVIASGGAANEQDLKKAIEIGASAVAAGSLFVYQGVHRAVLISYIKSESLQL